MKLRRKESELKQVITQAQGANTRLKYSRVELENLRKKSIVRCQTVGVACRRHSVQEDGPTSWPEDAEVHDISAPVVAGYFSYGDGPGRPGVTDPAAAAERGDQGGLHGEDQRPDRPGCVSSLLSFQNLLRN